jgi:hydrogenase maturation protease
MWCVAEGGASRTAAAEATGVSYPLVLAIGNGDRGDDAAGPITGRLLRERLTLGARIIEHTGEATSLLDVLQSSQHVWLIDAAQSGATPGTIHRIDCAIADAVLPRDTASSHGFGVAEAIGLARALGTLPAHCIVYAIEAADFTAGASPSPAVTRSARQVADRIAAELAELR